MKTLSRSLAPSWLGLCLVVCTPLMAMIVGCATGPCGDYARNMTAPQPSRNDALVQQATPDVEIEIPASNIAENANRSWFDDNAVVRGQSPGYGSNRLNETMPGTSGQVRQPLPASGEPRTSYQSGAVASGPGYGVSPPAYGQGAVQNPGAAVGSGLPPPPQYGNFGPAGGQAGAVGTAPFNPFGNPPPLYPNPPPLSPTADVDVVLQETQTGRFQFGVGVNSDAGVTGQIVVDERNFDWQRVPTSYQDWVNGTAFRGAGQGFRLEAMPGNQVQRYLVSFTEPYLFGFSPISLNASGFFYNRRYFDWTEERLGGRVALGYRVPGSQDLSLSAAVRAEQVDLTQPRVRGVEDLERALGSSDFFSGRVQLTHDTRDMPFFPTEGQYLELGFEQAFGEFDYPRIELDYRRYFLVRERPDGSGRHSFAYSFRVGVSGAATPIFENYFAGGYSTLRGFDFRGASPVNNTVIVGGQTKFLGSLEYFFPITADDMVKGVFFCDFGTIEHKIEWHWENFRVAPGFGIRLNIPALGPAPLALDLAVPITHAPGDNIQNFSFFFGFAR